MSISANYPIIRPSLNLDFANTKALDPRVTFARASTATYYDGVTTALAEQNLLTYSQEFDNWSSNNTTVTANTTVAPDGTTTADTITDESTSGSHTAYKSVSSIISVNTTYTFSCYLKAGTSNYAYLTLQDAATSQRYFMADFDLSGGTVRTSGAGTSGTLTSATITSVGSGWYRCVIIGQVAAVGTTRFGVGVSDGTTAISTFGTIGYVGSGSTINAWGAQLEQRSSVTAYTPTTTQPITNYIPVLQTAAANVARFDHNPTTSESLGLLVEEQRTNLIQYSEEFDNASGWIAVGAGGAGVVTANTAVAPNGTITADSITEASGTISNNGVRNTSTASPAMTVGGTYTVSCYAKPISGSAQRYLVLQVNTIVGVTGTYRRFFVFDLQNQTAVGGGQTWTSVGTSVTPVGNGWYRCTGTFTADTSVGSNRYLTVGINDTYGANAWSTSATYTGDGFSGFHIWGAQFEAGAFPTSYIATTSASVTRAADTAVMTGTDFSSWFNNSEGTLYADFEAAESSTNAIAAAISDGTSNNYLRVVKSSGNILNFGVLVSGVSQALLAGNALVTGSFVKASAAYKVNDFATSMDGGAVTTDTSGTVPTVSQVNFGCNQSNLSQLNGHIRRIAYYPKRLSDTNLQALTS